MYLCEKMDVIWTSCGNHFTICVNQIIILYALNLCRDVCQLFFNCKKQFDNSISKYNSSCSSSSSSYSQLLPSSYNIKCYCNFFIHINAFISHHSSVSCIHYLLGEVPHRDIKKIVHRHPTGKWKTLFILMFLVTRLEFFSVQDIYCSVTDISKKTKY